MRTPSILLVALAVGWLAGCSSVPPPPKPGTAAFSWAEAKDGYRTGDLLETDQALLKLATTDNVYAAQARIWQLLVSAGLTEGYSELAAAYEAGSLRTTESPQRFRAAASGLRSAAATAALEFAQATHELAVQNAEERVELTFGFPPGSAIPPDRILNISSGVWQGDAEREAIQTAMLQRGVLRSVSAAVGYPADPLRAQALFQTPQVQVPREAFLAEMARQLYQASDLFSPQRMDRPDRRFLLCHEALQVLQSLRPTSDRQELIGTIEELLKKNSGI